MLRTWGLAAFPNTLANITLAEVDPNPLEVDWGSLAQEAAAYKPSGEKITSVPGVPCYYHAKTSNDKQLE